MNEMHDFYIFLLMLTSGVGLVIGYTAWLRRKSQGAIPLAILMFSIAIWAFFQIMVFLTPEFEIKKIYANLRFIGIQIVPIAFYALAWDYKHRTKNLKFKDYLKLMVFPAVCFEALWHNEIHNRFYTSVYLENGILILNEGPIFWINMLYLYFFIISGIYLFVRSYMTSYSKYRRQALLIVVSATLPIITNAAFIFDLFPNLEVDITPISFLMSGLLFFYALFYYGLLDIVPIARDMLVEEMEDMIIVLDNNHRVLDMNKKARDFILQKNADGEDYIGTSIYPILEYWPELLKSIMDTGLQYARVNCSKASETIYFDMNKSYLHDKRGGKIGEVIDLRDITSLEEALQEARQAKEAAESASKYKGYFLANMSHEIRTPLNAIIGIAEMLDSDRISKDEQKKYNNTIIRSAESLLAIINDILDLSKIEAGKMELERGSIDISRIVNDALEIFQISTANRSITINACIDEKTPRRLMGDGVKIRQVLMNLIGNAVKFTTKGSVDIALQYHGKEAGLNIIELSIKDTGIGIPENKLDTVFESFKQADSSTTRRFGGTGLGLSIVKSLVELMGGSITAESRLGEGSCFKVRLPLEDDNETAAVPQRPKETAVIDFSRLRLLVAEDNKINREVISLHLKKLGCTYELAENGLIALEKCKEGGYDAVLMDVQMPEMDGLEAAAAIRAMEKVKGGRLPIIALTASAMKEDMDKCFQAGMDAYISKPIKSERLMEVITALLDNKTAI